MAPGCGKTWLVSDHGSHLKACQVLFKKHHEQLCEQQRQSSFKGILFHLNIPLTSRRVWARSSFSLPFRVALLDKAMPDKRVMNDDHLLPEFNVRKAFYAFAMKLYIKTQFTILFNVPYTRTKAPSNFKVGGKTFLNNLYVLN